MANANIAIENVRIKGEGYCIGGRHPEPPLDRYPLLAWSQNHPRFGAMNVHLEDQSASVEQVAFALCETPSLDAVAAKFGTTLDHVGQAVDYAVEAGFLGV